jgi:NADH-quinone oxidoreductase subunit N
MTLAAFAIVILREREVEDGDQLEAFTGYGRRRPWAGVVMTLAMLSLAGFPPLAGFIGKFMLFSAAIDSDMLWLAIVGALASAVSVVYYLRVSIVMWSPAPVRDVAERTLRVPRPVAAVAITGGMAIIALAIWAQPVIDLCRDAGASLLP